MTEAQGEQALSSLAQLVQWGQVTAFALCLIVFACWLLCTRRWH